MGTVQGAAFPFRVFRPGHMVRVGEWRRGWLWGRERDLGAGASSFRVSTAAGDKERGSAWQGMGAGCWC